MIEKKSEGFGDTFAKFTHVTGIDKIVKKTSQAIGFQDCGCEKRQDILNNIFPYKNKENNNE